MKGTLNEIKVFFIQNTKQQFNVFNMPNCLLPWVHWFFIKPIPIDHESARSN